ncbi:MAG: nucleotidyltransferase domain-containing protein [Candidatus Tectomicrobia bacterium]|uniref:Nucleotidyltransferase domain-containing protein n=1 Tax=Tectimicrobiota bacterium TaxID=2528274 RepID=A0A932GQT9_UNCTE|nr:nucleotidyltransferase domain-containing protein [Candidatus Tectomicrobia bacterium]
MTSDQEIESIVRRIIEGYQPLKVILFGSYAYGEATEDSDIDLLIVKETPERFIDRWVAVRELIADPERRTPVEPIVITPDELHRRLSRGDQFFQEILTRGKVLYAA